MSSTTKRAWFTRFAKHTATFAGRPVTFATAVSLILVWGVSGPVFGFSDTWQLVINTGTTIITFLMVFLIQNTQNRDSEAIHIKLDAIVKSMARVDNSLLNLEELDDEQLEKIRQEYLRLAEKARRSK